MRIHYNKPSLAPIECKCGCKIKFIPNRCDKVFINKAHYDAFYNNSIRPERTRFINRINRFLKRNYSILLQLMAEAEGEITKRSRDYLLGMGFRFEWYTSSINQMPTIWYAVYDMYYRFDEIDLNMISITRNRPSNLKKKKFTRLYARS